jgi:hypothetical protein
MESVCVAHPSIWRQSATQKRGDEENNEKVPKQNQIRARKQIEVDSQWHSRAGSAERCQRVDTTSSRVRTCKNTGVNYEILNSLRRYATSAAPLSFPAALLVLVARCLALAPMLLKKG